MEFYLVHLGVISKVLGKCQGRSVLFIWAMHYKSPETADCHRASPYVYWQADQNMGSKDMGCAWNSINNSACLFTRWTARQMRYVFQIFSDIGIRSGSWRKQQQRRLILKETAPGNTLKVALKFFFLKHILQQQQRSSNNKTTTTIIITLTQ